MKKVEFFEEDNMIVIDDQYDTTDFNFYPETKKFEVSSSIKNDCFYNNQTIEYRISIEPVLLEMRTLEMSHEPPLEYSIKDGVVLESQIKKDKFLSPDRIENLKKQIEWSKINILGNYEVNLYILSKHPEIIPIEEYRKFLRQSVERLKLGAAKAEESVKGNTQGLQFQTGDYGNQIWYLVSESDKKESDEYWKLSKEKRDESAYGKKIEYAQKFNDSLFNENSAKYVGVDNYEFQHSKEIIDYIEGLLDKKKPIYRVEAEKPNVNKKSGNALKWWAVIILSIIALSWGIWTAIGIFVLGSIIISLVSKSNK